MPNCDLQQINSFQCYASCTTESKGSSVSTSLMVSRHEALLFSCCFLLAQLPLFSLCEDDTVCLRDFRNSISDPNGFLAGWNLANQSSGGICTLAGITCWNNQENKVLSISLPGVGLSGTFPSGLNGCLSLQQLDLSRNSFHGPIPSGLCQQLPYLTSLDLSFNQFTGQIPTTFDSCKYLNSLHLESNQLSGQLPPTLGSLPRLVTLNLSSNLLTGPIPDSYSNIHDSELGGNSGLCGSLVGKSCFSSINTGVIVGAILGAAAAIAILLALCLWWKFIRRKGGHLLFKNQHNWGKRLKRSKSVTISLFAQPLVRLKLSDLMVATKDFSKDSIIGTGKTGTVYKACLRDGSVLAVKRLNSSPITDKQFISEITTLGEFRHRNLAPLLGYCVTSAEKLLLYKHMPNGSLKEYLHDSPEKSKPDWTSRLKIGIGAARCLAWLHHSCNPRIIHGNMSSGNILLDDEFEARITDLGFAHSMKPASTQANDNFGDVGYVAPEYFQTLVATVKGDVYSFGIILIELVTGQRATDVCAESGFRGNLAEWATYLFNNGRTEEAIDLSLKGKGADDELGQFLSVACSCIRSTPKDRPTMYEVYHLLKAIGEKFGIADDDELHLYTGPAGNDVDEPIVGEGD